MNLTVEECILLIEAIETAQREAGSNQEERDLGDIEDKVYDYLRFIR